LQKNKQKENVKEESEPNKNKGIFPYLLHAFYISLFLLLFSITYYIYFFDLKIVKETISEKINRESFNLEKEKISIERSKFYSDEKEKILSLINDINAQLQKDIKKLEKDIKLSLKEKNSSLSSKEIIAIDESPIIQANKKLRSDISKKMSILTSKMENYENRLSEIDKKLKYIEEKLLQIEKFNNKKEVNFSLINQSKILLLLKDFSKISYDVLEQEVATQNNQKLTDRIVNYFKSIFVSRSVAPIEGTSTDAILSRIEDFLKKGQLNEARNEIEKLPTKAKELMSKWIQDFNSLIDK